MITGESKRLLATAGVAVAVMALLTLAVAYASADQASFQTTSFSGSSSSTTSTTSTGSSSSYSTGSASGSMMTGGCNTSVNSSENAFSLRTAPDSSAALCVRYFYYNQTAPMPLNPDSVIKIYGWNPANSSLFMTNSDFTIASQHSTVMIGGPANENEGVEINYTITANVGTNGTYDVSVGQFLLPAEIGCSGQFFLVSGDGQPDYAGIAPTVMCAALPMNDSASPYTPGFLLVRIIGATNSSLLAGEDV